MYFCEKVLYKGVEIKTTIANIGKSTLFEIKGLKLSVFIIHHFIENHIKGNFQELTISGTKTKPGYSLFCVIVFKLIL